MNTGTPVETADAQTTAGARFRTRRSTFLPVSRSTASCIFASPVSSRSVSISRCRPDTPYTATSRSESLRRRADTADPNRKTKAISSNGSSAPRMARRNASSWFISVPSYAAGRSTSIGGRDPGRTGHRHRYGAPRLRRRRSDSRHRLPGTSVYRVVRDSQDRFFRGTFIGSQKRVELALSGLTKNE
jgi:hypothetical protein